MKPVFPTFSTKGFESTVPCEPWEAARQALGITLAKYPDNVHWFKETYAGKLCCGDFGINTNSNMKDVVSKLNEMASGFSFEEEYYYYSSNRPERTVIAVDESKRTAVVFAGDRKWGDDGWCGMLVFGAHAKELADAVNSHVNNGSLGKEAELAPFFVYTYPDQFDDGSPLLFYKVDLVKLEVTCGNGWHNCTFNIDRW